MTSAVDITITQYLKSNTVKSNIENLLKDRASQFITSIISLVNNTESLQDVEKKSLLNACLKAAALNLPIDQNLGFAYIIPYKHDGVAYAQFQMGYKGFIQLAMRTNQYRTIDVIPVYEGDTDETIKARLTSILKPTPPSTKVVGYVAYFLLLNGFEKYLHMTREELNAHGVKFSANYRKYNSGLWKDEFDAMARKTVLKLLISKYGPMSSEMMQAHEADQAVLADKTRYVDNKKQAAEDLAREKEDVRIMNHINNATTIEDLKLCEQAVKDSNDAQIAEAYVNKEKELEGKNG